MKNKIKLGIIGVGNIGSSHVNNILRGACPEIELVAVADLKPDRLEWAKNAVAQAAQKNSEIPSEIALFTNASEMITSNLIDAVIVSVPHYYHPRYVIEAFRANLHVMCEKPAGVYTLQVREMIAEADRHPDLKFGMMFNQRTDCIYRKMREIIQSNQLGEIKRTSWIITSWYRSQFYYDSGSWRATWSGEGGGVLLNQCPHNLDLWQWICGMPTKISAKMHFGKWHDIEVEDDVSAYCEYANGATGTFITTTGDAPGTNRFEIVCDGGTLVSDGRKLTMYKLDVPESVFSATNKSEVFGRPKCTVSEVETDGLSPQHTGVMNAFAAAILHGEPLIADGREGIKGLTISNAMHLSAWTNSEVTIPFDEQLFKKELMKRVATSRRKVADDIISDTSGTYNI